jgi:hypothetical protein
VGCENGNGNEQIVLSKIGLKILDYGNTFGGIFDFLSNNKLK